MSICRVDPVQMRLRMGPDIGDAAPWLASITSSIEVEARGGPENQLIIGRRMTVLPQELDADNVGIEEPGDSLTVLLRYHAAMRKIRISREQRARRFTLTLSADLAELGFGPKRGELAGVFAYGDTFEVWNLNLLRENLRDTAARLSELQRLAAEEMNEQA